ncbi:MAG: hypothetical protein KAR45_14735, partial [Desulfobacteraceae bacterium]|nr:hypothetical protein [Desulfobacteraceae bacterium]
MKDFKKFGLITGLLFVIVICFSLSKTVLAEKRIEKDLDEDGKIDQVLIYNDAGTILRVEIDKDHDGFSERVQLYKDGKPYRINRDTDNDKRIDCIDYIENQKRVRQERLNLVGNLIQVILFDE